MRSLALLVLAALSLAQAGRDPLPKVSGPVAATAESYPFAAADHAMLPFDLAGAGYVEEEYFVSGTAQVYDWPAGKAVTPIGSGPYTTRILVRRPRAAGAFSGAVWVEPLYPPRRWDWPMMWGYLRDGLIARGDAWVGVTMPGANLAGLKRFNAARYASLSFANPTPDTPCPGTTNKSDTEAGLRWDALTQIAGLLKHPAADAGPLRGLRVGAVYLTVQAGDLEVYANAFQPATHAFDGFLARAPFSLTSINRCAPAPSADDPRQVVQNVGVPVVAVAGEGDLVNTYVTRRPDSDAPGDRYRLYEVAGAAHIDRFAYLGFPSMKDQDAAGNAQGTPEWPFTAPCTPAITLMDQSLLRAGYDVAMAALDGWVRHGIVPKRAPRVETKPATDKPGFTVVADAYGNGRGGVRTPYVDVPVAHYVTSSPGPGNCPEIGHVDRFDAARLTQMYGSFDRYASRVRASIAQRSQEGWLTKADARRLSKELVDDERPRWSRP